MTRATIVSGLILVLSLCGVANAATLRVGDGQTYTTIQAALDVARAGDVISVVTPKTYDEQLTLKSSGTLGNPITLQNDSGGVVWVESANGIVLNANSKDYWTIEGTRFKYSGNSSYSTIDVSSGNPSSSYFTLDNCHVVHTGGSGSLIYLRWADHVTIQNCLFQQAGGGPSDGIRCFNSFYVEILNNEIAPTDPYYGKDGMCLTGTDYNVEGNFVHDAQNGSHPDGIVIQGQTAPATTANIKVHGNIVRNWGQLIYWDAIGSAFSGTNLCYNNVLYRLPGWGADCNAIVIDGENLSGSYWATPVQVYNNTIAVAGLGIHILRNGGGAKPVKNNIFYNIPQYGYILIEQITGVEFDYNEYSGGQTSCISWGGTNYTFSSFKSSGKGELNGINAVAKLDNDYKPQSDSGSIDQGLDLSSIFLTDKAGISRPQGLAWDIGAYEYAQAGPLPPAPTGLNVIPE